MQAIEIQYTSVHYTEFSRRRLAVQELFQILAKKRKNTKEEIHSDSERVIDGMRLTKISDSFPCENVLKS